MMPAYTFKCKDCGATEVIVVPSERRDDAARCSKCGEFSLRRTLDAPKFIGSKQKGYYNSLEKQIENTLDKVKM